MEPDALETFFPGARFLEPLAAGEAAFITAPATQGEVDAALEAAGAAGGKLLSRITVLEGSR